MKNFFMEIEPQKHNWTFIFQEVSSSIKKTKEAILHFSDILLKLEEDNPFILTGYKVYDHIENDIVGLFLEGGLSKTRKVCEKISAYSSSSPQQHPKIS